MSGPEWENLHKSALALMRRRLGESFSRFAEVCESISLLRENFLEIDSLARSEFKSYDVGYVCSMCASAVVSAANHYGGNGDTATARELAGWALLLESECIPALLCLQTCATLESDEQEAQARIQQAIGIYNNLLTKSPDELSAYQHGLVDAGKQGFGT